MSTAEIVKVGTPTYYFCGIAPETYEDHTKGIILNCATGLAHFSKPYLDYLFEQSDASMHRHSVAHQILILPEYWSRATFDDLLIRTKQYLERRVANTRPSVGGMPTWLENRIDRNLADVKAKLSDKAAWAKARATNRSAALGTPLPAVTPVAEETWEAARKRAALRRQAWEAARKPQA